MTKTITFNELRRIKDSLPDGSIQRIADELGLIFKMDGVVVSISSPVQTEGWLF